MAQTTATIGGETRRGGTLRPERWIRRWLIGYIAVLMGTLPLALPVWNGFLIGTVGRVVTVAHLHVAQYSVLGWLTAWYAQARSGGMRGWVGPGLLGGGVGLLDEIVQRWLPGRVFDWVDVGWNLAGLVLGMSAWSGWSWLTRAVTSER